jgi:ABC-type xylose transport system permease subunit
MKTILARWVSPTPKFFKKVRNIGLVMGALGTAIVTAPVSIPILASTIGGYLVAAGGVITAISQLTTSQDEATPPSLAAVDEQQ